MNFYDTITKMEYSIKDKNNERISIVKLNTYSNTVIIFDLKNKKLFGYVMPKEPIYDIDQITKIYADFNNLNRDLSTLSSISKYDIIK